MTGGEEPKRVWIRKELVLPFVATLASGALIALLVQYLTSTAKELSYMVDGPIAYADDDRPIGSVEIRVDGVPVPNLYTYTVTVWNSGDEPLRDLPLRLVFGSGSEEFKVLSIKHTTRPAHEFGRIDDAPGMDRNQRRFVFELLNVGDRDTISVVTTHDAGVRVFSKIAGLTLVDATDREHRGEQSNEWIFDESVALLCAALIGLVLVLDSRAHRRAEEDRDRERERVRRFLRNRKQRD